MVDQIRALTGRGAAAPCAYSDVVLLARTNATAARFAEALEAAGLPVARRGNSLGAKAVADLLAVLRAVADARDRWAASLALGVLAPRLGADARRVLRAAAAVEGARTLLDAASEIVRKYVGAARVAIRGVKRRRDVEDEAEEGGGGGGGGGGAGGAKMFDSDVAALRKATSAVSARGRERRRVVPTLPLTPHRSRNCARRRASYPSPSSCAAPRST